MRESLQATCDYTFGNRVEFKLLFRKLIRQPVSRNIEFKNLISLHEYEMTVDIIDQDPPIPESRKVRIIYVCFV